MSEKTKPIGCRLPLSHVARLEERAKQAKVSTSELIRGIVAAALENRDENEAIQRVQATLLDSFNSLEEKLARITVVLLTDAGQADRTEAEEWVDEFLREEEE